MFSVELKYISLVIIIFSAFMYKLMHIDFSVVELCELDKKPFIFGDDLCSGLLNSNVEFETGYLSRFFALFGHKVVFKTKINGTNVVLKKLGTREEFELFDSIAKTTFDDVHSVLNSLYIQEQILYELHSSISEDTVPKFHLCPRPKNANKFLTLVFNGTQISNVDVYLQVWTSLKLNPEPLILKILTPPLWPVPRYYGSCGRLAMFEDCGEMLTKLHDFPWSLRANLSDQLISAAFKFTFDHPDFRFYLTDISAYNIVMDDTGRAIFIDLENIIVLDKGPSSVENPERWQENHTSYPFECPDCFSYSTEDICSHRVSDHNIYGLCKEIFSNSSVLPGGFLHSAPSKITPLLKRLVAECVNPSGLSSRFDIARSLQKLIVKNL